MSASGDRTIASRSPLTHLHSLTGSRFFAAAYVVTYHYAAGAMRDLPAAVRNIAERWIEKPARSWLLARLAPLVATRPLPSTSGNLR